MILVKFILRSAAGNPGGEVQIAKGKLPAVPRVGESVVINDVARTVHSVEWDVTKMEVIVRLEH